MQIRQTIFIALGVATAIIAVMAIFELVRQVERSKLADNFYSLSSQPITGNLLGTQMFYQIGIKAVPNLSKLG